VEGINATNLVAALQTPPKAAPAPQSSEESKEPFAEKIMETQKNSLYQSPPLAPSLEGLGTVVDTHA
jgi:hypothetical protein